MTAKWERNNECTIHERLANNWIWRFDDTPAPCKRVVSIYTLLSAEWSQDAYGMTWACLMPGGCGQFSRLHVAKQCYDNKVFTVPPKSNEGYQPFHLLCMSFLVVRPLEEEARLWSHLTGPRCNLNYSSDMKGISLKGTDVSRLRPCVKLKARCSDSPKLNCVCVHVCVCIYAVCLDYS